MKRNTLGMALGLLGAAILFPAAQALSSDQQAAYQALDRFGYTFERVRQDYIRPVDDAKIIDHAINAMVSSLDPLSSYTSPDELADMNGRPAGIGLGIAPEYTLARIVSVADGEPAAAAGIKPGDYIAEIDGRSIQGLPLQNIETMLAGPAGSTIALTILRNGEQKPLHFTASRVVPPPSVAYRREGQIGYIRIKAFRANTASLVERAVADLKRDIGPGLKGYVLDLRNNPGGLFDQVVAVADDFLDDGQVISTRGRKPEDNRTYNAKRGDIAEAKPIIALIDEGTVSGAEIVAGALKDNYRATILGTKTYGRGSIQTIIPIGDRQRGSLRLTTAQYYLPSGRAMEPEGIEPDIAVMPAPQSNSGNAVAPQYEVLLPCCFPAWSQPSRRAEAAYPDPGKPGEDLQLARVLERLSGP